MFHIDAIKRQVLRRSLVAFVLAVVLLAPVWAQSAVAAKANAGASEVSISKSDKIEARLAEVERQLRELTERFERSKRSGEQTVPVKETTETKTWPREQWDHRHLYSN